MFDSLKKIFYSQPQLHNEIYEKRFNAPFSSHLGFEIKQFNHEKAYPAFFYYTEDIALLTEKIYKQFENFIYLLNALPPVMLHQFALSSIVEEVKSTNDIEGVRSTRQELIDTLEQVSTSNKFSSIIKKYDMLLSAKSIHFYTCSDVRKFYDEFVHHEVAADNIKNKLDGRIFRKETVDIQSSSGKVLHRGIYPEEKIIESLELALKILNNENIPFIIRIAVFHYYFAYIHPFYDGNGRTDRFITSYYIAQHFHYLVALRLSVTIKKQRSFYQKLLKETDSEINMGDLTPFIYGFASIISQTFQDIEDILKRKLEQLKKYKKKIIDINPNDEFLQNFYYILLQASLFFGLGISMDDLMQLTGKSRNTIKNKLASIPDDHIIIRKNKKNYYKLNMMLFKKL